MSDREQIESKLGLIAARAKQLSVDYKNNKLWGGELREGILELTAYLNSLFPLTRNDR